MAREEYFVDRFDAIGTRCEVLVYRSTYPKEAMRIAHAEIREVDAIASFHSSDSELTRINVAPAERIFVSETLFEIFEVFAWAYAASTGLCDPAVGGSNAELVFGSNQKLRAFMQDKNLEAGSFGDVQLDRASLAISRPVGTVLDLGGLTKSWLADRIAARIVEATGGGVLVNLGGDIAVVGAAPERGWRVNVTHDVSLAPDSPGQEILVSSGGIATSSRLTRRWTDSKGASREHLERSDGVSLEDSPFVGATAAGRSALLANFYTLTSLLSGRRAIATMARYSTPALIRATDGTRVSLGGWPSDGASSKYTKPLVGAQ